MNNDNVVVGDNADAITAHRRRLLAQEIITVSSKKLLVPEDDDDDIINNNNNNNNSREEMERKVKEDVDEGDVDAISIANREASVCGNEDDDEEEEEETKKKHTATTTAEENRTKLQNDKPTTITTTSSSSSTKKKQKRSRSHHHSRKKDFLKRRDRVAVFNANTPEGGSIVRSLSITGECDVVAIVRVVTSKNVKKFRKFPSVTVKVADTLHDVEDVAEAIQGCDRVFLVTKYWEKFDGPLEQTRALTVFDACRTKRVRNVVLATFEDTTKLREKGEFSQIKSKSDGTIKEPEFYGMKKEMKFAKDICGVRVTHMITSYFDQANSKRSLTVIKGEGKLIVTPYVGDE